jgi:membrane-associated phospholipid phosphatase
VFAILLGVACLVPTHSLDFEIPADVAAEGALLATSVAAYAWTAYMAAKPLVVEELDHGPYRAVDPGLSRAGTWLAGAALSLPGFTSLGSSANLGHIVKEGTRYASTVLMAAAVKDGIKAMFPRPRPHVTAAPSNSIDEDAYRSFPSGHSTLVWTAAAVAAVRGVATPGWGVADWSAACSVAAAVGVSVLRVAAGEHYVSDVVAGALLGIGIGILMESLPFAAVTADREATAPRGAGSTVP